VRRIAACESNCSDKSLAGGRQYHLWGDSKRGRTWCCTPVGKTWQVFLKFLIRSKKML